MTSGVLVPLLLIGLWDRVKPVGASSTLMIMSTLIIQYSLTNGYLPYGSSDILVPTFIGIAWILELNPRFGGVVDQIEYKYWGQCCYAILLGVLLRAVDIKRNNTRLVSQLFMVVVVLSLLFVSYLGYEDWVLFIGVLSSIIVYTYPLRGHVLWHITSSFAMYIWWYNIRQRSSDPEALVTPSADRAILSIALYITVKNAIRRIIMLLPTYSSELKQRYYILSEHVLLTIFGYYILVVAVDSNTQSSMLFVTSLAWTTAPLPTPIFHLYYLIQIATRLEDLLYMSTTIYLDSTATSMATNDSKPDKSRDIKMLVHHIVTAVLCVSSYMFNYTNIGAIILFLHDISDIPLDCLRLFKILKFNVAMSVSYVFTLLFWFVWRIYYFAFYVLRSVAVESKSLIYPTSCMVGQCAMHESIERIPFLSLLTTLFILHLIWFRELILKGMHEFLPTKSVSATAAIEEGDNNSMTALLTQKDDM
jgi:TLC domain